MCEHTILCFAIQISFSDIMNAWRSIRYSGNEENADLHMEIEIISLETKVLLGQE
jgi:hypothetical protein